MFYSFPHLSVLLLTAGAHLGEESKSATGRSKCCVTVDSKKDFNGNKIYPWILPIKGDSTVHSLLGKRLS